MTNTTPAPEPAARYDCESTGWDRTDFDMVESPDGRYVEYKDYSDLLAYAERMRVERDEAVRREQAALLREQDGK